MEEKVKGKRREEKIGGRGEEGRERRGGERREGRGEEGGQAHCRFGVLWSLTTL